MWTGIQSVYCSYISYIFLCKAFITSYIFAYFLYFPVFFFVIVADHNAKLCAALLAKDLQMASIAKAVFEASQKKCKTAREQLEAIESNKKSVNRK